MSAEEFAYGEQLPVPRRRGPAFGDAGPPPEVEAEEETRGPLGRRAEVMLGLAILMPVLAVYGAISYGLYALISSAV